jgi:hypothetical protein
MTEPQIVKVQVPGKGVRAEETKAQPERRAKSETLGPSVEIHWSDRTFTYSSKEAALKDGFHI